MQRRFARWSSDKPCDDRGGSQVLAVVNEVEDQITQTFAEPGFQEEFDTHI